MDVPVPRFDALVEVAAYALGLEQRLNIGGIDIEVLVHLGRDELNLEDSRPRVVSH